MIPWLNTVGGRRQSRRRCAEATVTVALAPQPPGGAHTGRCIVSFSGSVGARPALLTDAGFSADCVIIAAAPARRPRGLDGVSAPARASSTPSRLPPAPRLSPTLAGGGWPAARALLAEAVRIARMQTTADAVRATATMGESSRVPGDDRDS